MKWLLSLGSLAGIGATKEGQSRSMPRPPGLHCCEPDSQPRGRRHRRTVVMLAVGAVWRSRHMLIGLMSINDALPSQSLPSDLPAYLVGTVHRVLASCCRGCASWTTWPRAGPTHIRPTARACRRPLLSGRAISSCSAGSYKSPSPRRARADRPLRSRGATGRRSPPRPQACWRCRVAGCAGW
jgi:hypothetical protein